LSSITKLKPQRNKNWLNVFLDGQFAFGLPLEEVVKRKLTAGQVLSQEEVKDLFFSSQLNKLFQKVLNFLSYRPRSKKEISSYLDKNLFKRKGLNRSLKKEIKGRILTKLEKKKLIDDYQFAQWWVNQRLSFRPRGKRMLQAELFKKGVDKEVVNQLLEKINESQLEELAKKIINKKIGGYKDLKGFKLRKKLNGCLVRRGFDYQLIRKVIDEVL